MNMTAPDLDHLAQVVSVSFLHSVSVTLSPYQALSWQEQRSPCWVTSGEVTKGPRDYLKVT